MIFPKDYCFVCKADLISKKALVEWDKYLVCSKQPEHYRYYNDSLMMDFEFYSFRFFKGKLMSLIYRSNRDEYDEYIDEQLDLDFSSVEDLISKVEDYLLFV